MSNSGSSNQATVSRQFHVTKRLVLIVVSVGAALLLMGVLKLESALPALYAAIILASILSLSELVELLRLLPVTITRTLPTTLAVGRPGRVRLEIVHTNRRPLWLNVFDHAPQSVVQEAMPAHLLSKPGVMTSVDYGIRATERGVLDFPCVQWSTTGRFGLLLLTSRTATPGSMRVFPDFSAIADFALLSLSNHVNQLGIHRKQRRGDGSDFHQLRQYRFGDTLKQVNWKASAKRQQLISRENQEERDQQIIVMVDSGRRMRARDDELSHYDHALNAMMLLSYIALRQGDSVGVLAFGNTLRWIPPQRGEHHTSNILNGIFDLQSGVRASDYLEAARQLVSRQQKRSLVVLLTNTRDEDSEDLLHAAALLRGRHLLLLANIREAFLDRELGTPVHDFVQALRYCGLRDYSQTRTLAHRRLTNSGIHNIDCLASELPAKVANAYLEIKSAGLL